MKLKTFEKIKMQDVFIFHIKTPFHENKIKIFNLHCSRRCKEMFSGGREGNGKVGNVTQ
jgi:hypothetical protein